MSIFGNDAIEVQKSPKPSGSIWGNDAIQEKAPELSLADQAYEAAYPYMRSAENLVPLGASLQHTYIDPLIGMARGTDRKEVQADREAYDAYYRKKYPGKLEGTQMGSEIVGGAGLLKKAATYLEPAVNQAFTHPESIGANLQTVFSALPLAGAGLAHAPSGAAKALGWLKTKEAERPSLRAYEKNPQAYDDYMTRTDGRPRESLVREMMTDLESKEAGRLNKVSAAEEGMTTANADKSAAALGESVARQNVVSQQRNAKLDVKDATALGTHEGDTARRIISDLNENYKTTAEARNKILDESNGLQDHRAFQPIFENAKNSVILSDSKRIIDEAWVDFASNATDDGLITARQVNDFRAKLQNSVNYESGHMTPWEIQYNKIARGLNEALDESIPMNQPLRNQIKEETKRYNMAKDLFGNKYPLQQLESAIKDPMKLRDLENLGSPDIQDIIKTVQYRQKFNADWDRGIRPEVPAQADMAGYTESKNKALMAYLENKKALEAANAEKFPMSEKNVESTLNSSMVANRDHPRAYANNMLDRYANEVHQAGAGDFAEQYAKNKVLRDVGTLDVANGSRMTNLGANIGGVFGAPGRAAGAVLGASLDYGAGAAFRGMTKYGQTPNLMSAVGNAMAPLTKRYQEKLQGTKYANMFTGDSAKDAIAHKLMFNRDPEYARLVSGEQE